MPCPPAAEHSNVRAINIHYVKNNASQILKKIANPIENGYWQRAECSLS
jgi:hypothetical protein